MWRRFSVGGVGSEELFGCELVDEFEVFGWWCVGGRGVGETGFVEEFPGTLEQRGSSECVGAGDG